MSIRTIHSGHPPSLPNDTDTILDPANFTTYREYLERLILSKALPEHLFGDLLQELRYYEESGLQEWYSQESWLLWFNKDSPFIERTSILPNDETTWGLSRSKTIVEEDSRPCDDSQLLILDSSNNIHRTNHPRRFRPFLARLLALHGVSPSTILYLFQRTADIRRGEYFLGAQVMSELEPWFDKSHFIQVGSFTFLILDAIKGRRPYTVIIVCQSGWSMSESVRMNVFPPTLPHDSRFGENRTHIPPTNRKVDLLICWILNSCDPSKMLCQELACACLDGLLRFQIMQSPLVQSPRKVGRIDDHLDTWNDLRVEIDRRRLTHINLPSFVRRHFDPQNQCIAQVFSDIDELHQRTIKELETLEAQLLYRMELSAGERNRTMATLSIRESKRVKILTMLAFVFIPVSLASSIYGMNVQQINKTGPSITVFFVTAVGLVVMAFGMWGGTTMVIHLRRRAWQRVSGNRGSM